MYVRKIIKNVENICTNGELDIKACVFIQRFSNRCDKCLNFIRNTQIMLKRSKNCKSTLNAHFEND